MKNSKDGRREFLARKPIRTSPPKKETAPDMTEAEIIKDLTETEVQSNEPS
uniref:hypothetical protein n=1 Tax=Ruminococcus bromii TaxID=40518 RepID=UPI0040271FCD